MDNIEKDKRRLEIAKTVIKKLNELEDEGALDFAERQIIEMVDSVVKAGAENFIPTFRDGEPIFLLCGRDPVAPYLIEAWAWLRTGHVVMGKKALDGVVSAARVDEPQRNDDPQILDAFRKALDARAYQQESALGTGRFKT